VQVPRRGFGRAAGEDVLAAAAPALARAGFADPSLVLRWAEIVGPEVARVAEPLRLTEGPEGAVLALRAEPGAAVFLQHETRALLERLNAYLGANQGAGRITRIRLVNGALSRPAEPPPHPAAAMPQSEKAGQIWPLGLAGALDRLSRLRTRLRNAAGMD